MFQNKSSHAHMSTSKQVGDTGVTGSISHPHLQNTGTDYKYNFLVQQKVTSTTIPSSKKITRLITCLLSRSAKSYKHTLSPSLKVTSIVSQSAKGVTGTLSRQQKKLQVHFPT